MSSPISAFPTVRSIPAPIDFPHHSLHFQKRAYIMGIVNTTPDSFSDGGKFANPQAAIEHALELVELGADMIDIGGESTRPGADPVAKEEELRRVVPVIEGIRRHTNALISIDTYKADVAREAYNSGANIINDISGLGFDPDMASTVAQTGCALVLMHIRGTPKTMQNRPCYDDLMRDIHDYFEQRIDLARVAGVDTSKIILDPGIGFGKTLSQNYHLLSHLSSFSSLGHALLVGTSRKRLIAEVLQKPVDERIFGTAATVACAILSGANIVRVHDVKEMHDVVRVSEALCGMGIAEVAGETL